MTQTTTKTATEINKAIQGLGTAREWNDRIYINPRGNGGNFRGEQTTKVYVAPTGEIVVARGKGRTSSEYDANLRAILARIAELEAAVETEEDTVTETANPATQTLIPILNADGFFIVETIDDEEYVSVVGGCPDDTPDATIANAEPLAVLIERYPAAFRAAVREHPEHWPVQATTLDELCAAIKAGDPRTLDAYDEIRADLPTFGGETPPDTREVWSWDAGRMIVGTCAGDLRIVSR